MNLIAEFERFEASRVKGNPGREESRTTSFMQYLAEEGTLQEYTDADWLRLSQLLGMTDDQYAAMFEGTASWVVPEPEAVEDQPAADWPDEVPRPRVDSPPVTRGNPGKRGFHSGPTARRGTRQFDELLAEMLEEWDVEEDLVDDIVELRRYEDTFEYRLKGHAEWELLEDDGDDEDDVDDDDDSQEEE